MRRGNRDRSTRRRIGGGARPRAATAFDGRRARLRPGRRCVQGRPHDALASLCSAPIVRRARRCRETARRRRGRPARKCQSAQHGTSPIMTSGGRSSFSTRLASHRSHDRRATNGHSISLVRRNPSRDLDNRMRPTGFAQVVKHNSGFPAPAHQGRPASICPKGKPERQCPLLERPRDPFPAFS